MRAAVIDIGSNSLRLLVAEKGTGNWRPVVQKSVITGLGKKFDDRGYLGEEQAQLSLETLSDFRMEIAKTNAVLLDAVATCAVREAVNGKEFVSRAEGLLGGKIRIISGAEEALLSYQGATTMLAGIGGDPAVFDLGGGSLEIVWAGGRSLHSLPLGSVRLTDEFIASDPPLKEEMDAVKIKVRTALKNNGIPPSLPGDLVGTGGTVTTLAAIDLGIKEYHFKKVHGYTLDRSRVEYWAERLSALTRHQREVVPGLQPRRAAVIPAGAVITLALMDWMEAPCLRVSAAGLLFGVINRFR